jgi:hypothetical protein
MNIDMIINKQVSWIFACKFWNGFMKQGIIYKLKDECVS